ncbi:hypothetical protein Q5752_004503 [Cryptotrichosporon argae]
MRVLVSLALLGLAAALPAHTAPVLRETVQEAARHARQMVREITTGTIASVFPDGSANAGRPFALMDVISYVLAVPNYASCGDASTLTFISFPISLSAHNIRASPAHHATYTVQMPVVRGVSEFSRARIAFIGNLTFLPDPAQAERAQLETCFTAHHPDAQYWLPGAPDGAHTSVWAQLAIDDIYYVGGFGDTKYVGHIPVELYVAIDELDAGPSQMAWIRAD